MGSLPNIIRQVSSLQKQDKNDSALSSQIRFYIWKNIERILFCDTNMSLSNKCFNATRLVSGSVYRPLLLGPKSISMPSLVLIEKLSTTEKWSFKMEYPSKNIALNTDDLILPDEKENISQNTRERAVPYSKEEIQVILDYVGRFGSNSSTFRLLEEELDRNWKSIQWKYYAFKNGPRIPPDARRRFRRFSKADDERIMNYIKEHGEHDSVFHALTAELNCRDVQVVKKRFIKLTTESKGPKIEMARNLSPGHNTLNTTLPNIIDSPLLKKPKNSKKPYWDVEEDKELLDIVFNNWKEGGFEVNLEEDEYDILCSLDTFKFTLFTEQLPRRPEASNQRWKKYLLPICKSYILKIPDFPESFFEWRKPVLNYIIKNRIENEEDIDAYIIEKEVCPGQTVAAIKHFIKELKHEKVDKADPLYKVCKRRLLNIRNPGINDYKKQFKLGLGQIEEIVKHYETIRKRLEIDQAIKISR